MQFLEINNIKKEFGENENKVQVLNGISVSINKGEVVVLLGPSGSGKSTLLNIIGGIENPDEGYISINGEKIEDMNESKLTQYRRKHLGYIFQMYNLVPNLTIRENIEVGSYLGNHKIEVDDLLEILGIKDQENKLPSQLSGGQQQRTSIARAVVKNPDILLVMYILTKQIIERNIKSISLTKILGFNDIEIGKLYLVITSLVVFASLLISVPIIDISMRLIFDTVLY